MTLAPLVLSLPDAAATYGFGQRLGAALPAGAVLLLQGDLGSGKTTLVKGLGAGLGLQETIDSPTFTLINEYLGGRLPLYHVDLYRLESDRQVEALLLETYWSATEAEPGIMAIEWAERLPHPPAQSLRLWLVGSGQGRQLTAVPATQPQADLLRAIADHAVLADEI